MKTFQDFEAAKNAGNLLQFIRDAITEYRNSTDYKTALDADEYEAERNVTIIKFLKWLYDDNGKKVVDTASANNRIASNFFHRLTTQRVAYSLGNGISFPSAQRVYDTQKKRWKTEDTVKEKLGNRFDTVLYKAGKFARIHGCSYPFWNHDHLTFFKMTEFVPLFDEEDGVMKAGIRFWSMDWNRKPVSVVLYEESGYTKFKTRKGGAGLDLVQDGERQAYILKVAKTKVDPEEIVGQANYSALPIVPFWGSETKQSDLIGMRSKIDSFDLVKSGFANDLEDCAQIYWIVGNAMGETPASLQQFRDRLKLQHIAVADTDNSPVTPYTQEIPVNARDTLLKSLREQIYEDYGGLDVHTVAAGATNDHIDAAYQPMDEEADDFEYQVIQVVQAILSLMGIDEVPLFHRNRVSNQKEQTDMVVGAAQFLDTETVIRKLPFITPDEVEDILARRAAEESGTFETEEGEEGTEPGTEGEAPEGNEGV